MVKPNRHFPHVIAEIAETAGQDAAWAIASAKGGTTVFIPQKAAPNHWLTQLVGFEAASKICDKFPSARILIPMAAAAQRAARWTEVVESDMSIVDSAKTMGAHQRTVSRRRAQLDWTARRNKRQGKLPF